MLRIQLHILISIILAAYSPINFLAGQEKNQFDSIDEVIFYIENNSVEDNLSINYNTENKFEIDLINAVISYKTGDYNKTYDLLAEYLDDAPKNFIFNKYLSASARITNKVDELLQLINDRKNTKDYKLLTGLIKFDQTNYQAALKNLHSVINESNGSIPVIIKLANSYRKLGDYKKATQVLNDLENKIDKSNRYYPEILIAKGSLQFLSGNYENAKDLYAEGLSIAKELGNNVEVIKAELNSGIINDILGSSSEAQNLFGDAYSLAKEINQKELEATVLSEWGVSLTYLMQQVEARKKYEESFEIFNTLNNYERMALTAINIGSQFLNINNYGAALKRYKLAVKLAGENPRTKMLAFRGLGDVYTNLSNYSNALEYYERAKKIAKKLKDQSAAAEINVGLGTLFYNLDQPERALENILENYDSINVQTNPYLKAELNQKAGIVSLALSNFETAEKYLSESIKISDTFNDIYSSILSNTFLGYAYISQGKIEVGKSILRKQINLSIEYDLNQLLGMQYLILSETLKNKAKYRNLLLAENHSLKAGDKSNLAEIYKELGDYFLSINNENTAEEYYLKGILQIEHLYNSIAGSSNIQIDFFVNNSGMYDSLIKLYIDKKMYRKAFAVNDLSRSKNTLFNINKVKLSASKNDSLVIRYYDLFWRQTNNLIDSSEGFKELQYLEEKLQVSSSLITLENLKNIINGYTNNTKLKTDEYFLKYLISGDKIYLFVLNNSDFKTIELAADINEVNKIISQVSPYYNSNLNPEAISFNKDLFAFKADKSHILFSKLFEPAIKKIPRGSKLIFSLPNELLKIPFDFFVLGYIEGGGNKISRARFLIEDYPVSYVPSYAILEKLQIPSRSNETVLIAGNPDFGVPSDNYTGQRKIELSDLYSRNINIAPLKYSEEEVEAIESYFSNDILLIGSDATETNIISRLENSEIIHLSTHSFLFDENPVIVVGKDIENNGLIEPTEIAELDLNSNLVVLSSCKSGLGPLKGSEGIIGLQKAFFDAGARSVILSLWDVSDKHTAELMAYFYDYLSKGYDKADALREAKIKFISEVNPNPYYWAAFTLAGNSDKIEIRGENSKIVLYFLFLLLLSTAAIIFIKNKIRLR